MPNADIQLKLVLLEYYIERLDIIPTTDMLSTVNKYFNDKYNREFKINTYKKNFDILPAFGILCEKYHDDYSWRHLHTHLFNILKVGDRAEFMIPTQELYKKFRIQIWMPRWLSDATVGYRSLKMLCNVMPRSISHNYLKQIVLKLFKDHKWL